MAHREIHRPGDEAFFRRGIMQSECCRHIGPRRDLDLWPQHNEIKLPFPAFIHTHLAKGRVAIGGHDNARIRAEMQIPKLMTRGERSNQKLFWVPPLRIAPKTWIG